jgi:signal transduction histidine kinase
VIGRIVLIITLFFVVVDNANSQDSEIRSNLLPGQPLIESINLFEISRYPLNWDITRDNEGMLWVGTGGNVMVFDGAKWSSYNVPARTARSLTQGFDNRIYVGGSSEFGFFGRNSSSEIDLVYYTSLKDLVPESKGNFLNIHNIIAKSDSSVLFNGTYHSFLYKDDILQPVSDDVWIFRLFDVNGRIFSNDSLGISVYNNEKLELIEGSEQFEFTGIFCLQPLDESSFIFSVRNEGLFLYDGSEFRKQESDASDFLKEHYPYTCQKLPDGSFFAGTLSQGGIRFQPDGTIIGTFNDQTGLEENTIYGSYLDPDGTLWISQFEHVAKLDFSLPIRIVSRESGLTGMPFSMAELNGSTYVGTANGVFKSEGNDISDFRFQKILELSSRSNVFQVNENLFAYTTRNLYSPEKSETPILSFPHPINFIYPSERNRSLFYAVSDRGLNLVYVEDDSYVFSKLLSNLNFEAASLAQTADGDLWIGSDSGILAHIPFREIEAFLANGQAQVKEYVMPDGWRGEGSRKIYPVLDGDEVILGTPRGLYRVDRDTDEIVEDNRFGELSRTGYSGGPNQIFSMRSDEEGNFWIRSSRHYQYAEKQSDGTFEIHKNILRRVNDDQSNQIVPLGDGKVWFLGSKGMVYYDHNLTAQKEIRPPIIRSVISRSDSLLFKGYSRDHSENIQLELPYSLNDFRIEFGFPDFSTFGQTQYEVKLEGFDSDWSIWSSEAQKDYTRIREGRYQFLVRARDATGDVTEASVLAIRILPPWYRTLWAYFLYFGVTIVLLYSIHKYRIDKILEIQKVRNRIASDLHDEVSSTLSSITFFTEAIEKNKEREKSAKYLKLISSSAGEAKEKMSDIIWSIDPEHDNWENLITKCKRYASDLFESKNIQYQLMFPEETRGKIEIELRQNIWLMFKELVTNVARHSKAEFVEVVVDMTGKNLVIEVKDNGKGFDLDRINKGNGLINIQKRAEQLGGMASLKSKEGQGTEWKIVIPL